MSGLLNVEVGSTSPALTAGHTFTLMLATVIFIWIRLLNSVMVGSGRLGHATNEPSNLHRKLPFLQPLV